MASRISRTGWRSRSPLSNREEGSGKRKLRTAELSRDSLAPARSRYRSDRRLKPQLRPLRQSPVVESLEIAAALELRQSSSQLRHGFEPARAIPPLIPVVATTPCWIRCLRRAQRERLARA